MKKILKNKSFNKIILCALLLTWIISHSIRFDSHAQTMPKADTQTKTDIQLKTDPQPKTDARLKINGKAINADYEVLLQNNRLMVPIRLVAETLGADIKWDNESKSVIMQSSGKKVILYVDQLEADVDSKKVALDVKPFLYKDRTMVPIRFLAEHLYCSVKWDHATRTASIDQTPGENNQIDYEVIRDFSKYPFLSEYMDDNAKYAFGKSFEKDGYSYAVISYGEQRTGGYAVKIDGVYLLEQEYNDQKLFVVKSHLQAPAPDAVVTMALTYPKAVIKFENKKGLEVRILLEPAVNSGVFE